MATDFPQFSTLPYELRALIWSFAAAPRWIHLDIETRWDKERGEIYRTCILRPAPRAPAVMHACRESRKHAPYQQAFHAVKGLRWRKIKPHYAWVNFEHDTICLPKSFLKEQLEPHIYEIRQLRMTLPERRKRGEFRSWEAMLSVGHYTPCVLMPALKVVELAAPDSFSMWVKAASNNIEWGSVYGECSFRLLDLKTGLMLDWRQAWMAGQWKKMLGGKVIDAEWYIGRGYSNSSWDLAKLANVD